MRAIRARVLRCPGCGWRLAVYEGPGWLWPAGWGRQEDPARVMYRRPHHKDHTVTGTVLPGVRVAVCPKCREDVGVPEHPGG